MVFSPTDWQRSAQGNALGTGVNQLDFSLKGWERLSALQAERRWAVDSQGVALG